MYKQILIARRPGRIKEIIDVKPVRDSEQWQKYEKIEDVMDLESFVHLRTKIWRLLREQHGPDDH